MSNIFITGVSSGIGLAIAEYFLSKERYHVFGTVRQKSDAQSVKKKLGLNFTPILMDVTDESSIKLAYTSLKNQCRDGISLLVNNAGIAVAGPLKHITAADLKKQLDVNLIGVLTVTNTFLPLLGGDLDSKYPPGKIMNVSSVSGLFNAPFIGPYCISKHALESLSDVYRRELSIYGIKVILIEPGPTKSEIWAKTNDISDKYLDTDYGEIWKTMTKTVEKTEKRAIPARQLAEKIYKVYKKRNPAARYIVTKNKFANWCFFYLVPTTIKDYFIKASLKKVIKK